jgi:ribonuclease-3
MSDLEKYAARLGLTFSNLELLEEALTHRSFVNENRDTGNHNERLEFLGDAVLQLASADFVYKKFPAQPEGFLSQYRAAMVNAVALSAVARDLGLNDMLRLSKGESRDTGRARDIILADACEAVLGALYLDQGYEAVDAFLHTHVFARGDEFAAQYVQKDAKSRFQELAQDKKSVTPIYRTLKEEGPEHDKRFTVGVYLAEEEIAEGVGKSKQEAEQAAAQAALEKTGW